MKKNKSLGQFADLLNTFPILEIKTGSLALEICTDYVKTLGT